MLGPPASGKGTQGRLLAEHLGFSYLSTGAQLRREVEKGSPRGLEAKDYLDRNHYVPDALANALASDWLSNQQESWVLDGYPRSLPQAQSFWSTRQDFRAIALQVSKADLQERVSRRRECLPCGFNTTMEHEICPRCERILTAREDDSSQGFQRRFEAYSALTVPALSFLEEKGILWKVDGSGTPAEVSERLFALL